MRKFYVEFTMKETINATEGDGAPTDLAKKSGPQGIGMAVAFDWGLTVQLLATPFLALLPGISSPFSRLNLSPTLTTVISTSAVLPFAALFAIFGEGVRRGWKWTRPVQIVFNTLGFVGGFAVLFTVWQSSKVGNYWPIVTAIILLIFSPLIAWRLSRPQTAQWFATVKSSAARKRHGGAWPFLIALWAIVGGVLQAIAASSR
jgi:hypothetical protein